MKKIVAFLCVLLLTLTSATACRTTDLPWQETGNLHILCSFFPQYDWTRELLKDTEGMDVSLLVDNGVDLHSYQPTAQDFIAIAQCDLLIYIGGESEAWIEDALEQQPNENRRVICLMDILEDSRKEEEVIEGMQVKPFAEAHDEDETEEEPEYDEHIWLSLKNADAACEAIAGTLTQLHSEDAAQVQGNYDRYRQQLTAMDKDFEQFMETAPQRTLLFADRFPFRYFVEDYGIDYYAAFPGCSAETTATFETLTFLAQQAEQYHLHHICIIDQSESALADSVIDLSALSNQQTISLNSMQSVQLTDTVSYLSLMQDNMTAIKEALSS